MGVEKYIHCSSSNTYPASQKAGRTILKPEMSKSRESQLWLWSKEQLNESESDFHSLRGWRQTFLK